MGEDNPQNNKNQNGHQFNRSFIECPKCSQKWSPSIRFCVNCGSPLPKDWYCPDCGSKNLSNHSFCINCGYSKGSRQHSPQITTHPPIERTTTNLQGYSPIRVPNQVYPTRISNIKCFSCNSQHSIENWTPHIRDHGQCPSCNAPLLPQKFILLVSDIFISMLILFLTSLGVIALISTFSYYLSDDISLVLFFIGLILTEFSLILIPYIRTKEHFMRYMGLIWSPNTPKEIFLGIIVGLLTGIFVHFIIAPFFGEPSNSLDASFLILIAILQFIVAFSEEILFRGYIQNSMQLILPKYQAMIISVLVFALVHLAISNIVAGLIVGSLIGCGYIFFEGRNHFGISCHWVYNATIFLIVLF